MGCKILTVAELIRYRLRNERYIVRAGESRIQTKYGEFRMIAYESEVNGGESHIALVRGDLCKECAAFNAGPAVGGAVANGDLPGQVALRRALRTCGAGAGAYAVHGGRCVCGRLPVQGDAGPVDADDCGGRMRGGALPAQYFAGI